MWEVTHSPARTINPRWLRYGWSRVCYLGVPPTASLLANPTVLQHHRPRAKEGRRTLIPCPLVPYFQVWWWRRFNDLLKNWLYVKTVRYNHLQCWLSSVHSWKADLVQSPYYNLRDNLVTGQSTLMFPKISRHLKNNNTGPLFPLPPSLKPYYSLMYCKVRDVLWYFKTTNLSGTSGYSISCKSYQTRGSLLLRLKSKWKSPLAQRPHT